MALLDNPYTCTSCLHPDMEWVADAKDPRGFKCQCPVKFRSYGFNLDGFPAGCVASESISRLTSQFDINEVRL